LYRNVDLLLKQSFEYLQILMRIVEDYLLLGQETFLQLYAESMVSSFDTVLGNVKTMGVICTLKPIEIFLQMFPQQAVRCLFDVVLKKLLVSTLIEKEDSLATVHCISIFARILLKDPTLFFSIFQHIASMETTEISMITNDRSALGLLIQFLEVWLEKMDVMPNSRMRKLSALALCNLLPTKEFRILNYLGQIISICISVIHGESSDPSLKDESEDGLDFADASNRSTSIGGSGIHAARQLLWQSDPVTNANVLIWLKARLDECTALIGPTEFERFSQSVVDPTISRQLQLCLQSALETINTTNTTFTH